MGLGKPIFVEFTKTDDKSIDDLYHELVDRYDHLSDSLSIYSQLLHLKGFDAASVHSQMVVRQALLWFMTVEFYSRFLSNPSSRTGSKRCLKKLLNKLADLNISKMYDDFLSRHKELIGYLEIQRHEYFAHAGSGDWSNFPKIFPEEYKILLNGIADIMREIQRSIGTQRIVNTSGVSVNIFKGSGE